MRVQIPPFAPHIMIDLLQKIKNVSINIDQSLIVDRLEDKFRWHSPRENFPPTFVEVIKPFSEFSRDFKFDMDEIYPNGFIDDKKVNRLLCSGHTLIISNVGTFHKDIRSLYEMLCAYFNCHVQINMYFGNGKKSVSFPPHNHPYDVIVKNVSGTSKWIIDNKEIILEDNNVLFIPRGADHCVTQIRGFKCSLTCNLPNTYQRACSSVG